MSVSEGANAKRMNAMNSANETKPASIEATDAAHGDHCFAKMNGDAFAAIVKHALEEFLGQRGATTLKISSRQCWEIGTILSITIGEAEFTIRASKND